MDHVRASKILLNRCTRIFGREQTAHQKLLIRRNGGQQISRRPRFLRRRIAPKACQDHIAIDFQILRDFTHYGRALHFIVYLVQNRREMPKRIHAPFGGVHVELSSRPIREPMEIGSSAL